MNDKSAGERAYNAWMHSIMRTIKNYTPWTGLPKDERDAWEASAKAAIEYYRTASK